MPNWTAINHFFEGLQKAVFYIKNPKELGVMLWNAAVSSSFYISLFICMAGLILYVIGIKKAALWVKISFFIYLSIQIFNWVV